MKHLLWLAALAVPGLASSADPATPGVTPQVQVVRATGAGAPNMAATSPAQARLGAERAAQMDAFRNLLEQAKGVRLSSGKTVGEAMASTEVRGNVEGVIRGFKVVDKRYFSDGGVELDVEVPLSAVLSAVEPAKASPEGSLRLRTGGEERESGLVIDASGLKVKPAPTLQIVTSDGTPVYDQGVVPDEVFRHRGLAGYFRSVEDARRSQRVGDRPLVVKATRLDGDLMVISADDLARLNEANNAYLGEARVAVVTQ